MNMTYEPDYRLGTSRLYGSAYPPAYRPAYPPAYAPHFAEPFAPSFSNDSLDHVLNRYQIQAVWVPHHASEPVKHPRLRRIAVVERIFESVTGTRNLETVLGDLAEQYNLRRQSCTAWKARRSYCSQFIPSLVAIVCPLLRRLSGFDAIVETWMRRRS